ncbi:MAG: aminotransferase class IV [Chloroflexi bacterium]|nr:aminotransferase class IV [Chloroflexota bacterium]
MRTQVFHLVSNNIQPLEFSASTLDEMTLRLPDGFYTTFSTLKGGTHVLGLQAHLDRLYRPANALRIIPSAAEADARHHIAALAQRYLPSESRIRLVLTKNSGDVYIGIQPFAPPPAEIYEKGAHVITTEMTRHDPRIKGTDFIAQSAEQRKLVKDDVFEILLTKHGGILEGMTSNFYAVCSVIASEQQRTKQSPAGRIASGKKRERPRNDGILITARRGILLGVTRRAVLRLARGEGMPIEYRPPRVDENFDEAFLTSSSRGVVPVVRINGAPVGQGKPGTWTKRLSLAYQAYVEERSEEILPYES